MKINYIKHNQFTISSIIRNRKKVNTELESLIQKIGENELHFSHTQFALFCFCLVKKLNDNGGRTVFHNFEFVYDPINTNSYFNRKLLKNIAKEIIIKWKYDLPLELRKSSEKSYVLSFSLKYINSYSFKIIDDKATFHLMVFKMLKTLKFDFPLIENLFIAQWFTNSSFFVEDKIIKILPLINDERVSIKYHPKLGRVESLPQCKKLPDFLPVEIFFQKVTKNVISFHSASLITASNFDNLNVISLLDLVKTNDTFLKKVKDDMIQKSQNKILFPQSISEFEQLLFVK